MRPTEKLAELFLAATKGDKTKLKILIETLPTRMLESKDNFGRTPLILSVVFNHLDCISLLLKAGVQVDNDDNAGQTALHAAVNKGFSRCVKILASYHASWRHRDFDGVTPLHLASISPNSKCLSIILKKIKPGEIDFQDGTKKTALHWSAGHAYLEHMKMLLAKDAHICIPDEEGKTPLHWAVTSQDPKALKVVKTLLLKQNKLINWQDYQGRAALHLAVVNPNIAIFHYLACREDCNVDILDNAFCTPLHWACRRGLWEKVNILLYRGASPTSADDSGATPMHYAAYYNHAKTVGTFLSRSFIHDVGDLEGRNSFMWAAARNSEDVLNCMAEMGADLAYADKIGATALHIATILNNEPAITLLLKLGTPVDIRDQCWMTPLMKACEWGRATAGGILLQFGANMYAVDKYGRSTLHWCAIGGHAHLCQILILKGAKYNTKDDYGRVPLHYTSRFNDNINCASVLLESGANPNVADNKGMTPLHLAVLNDRFGVCRMLCKRDADVNAMTHINDWLTPLDCAMVIKNSKIITLLKKYKALRACEIKNYAASIIQAWYQKVRRRRNPKSISSNMHHQRKKKIAISSGRFCPSCSADLWGGLYEDKTKASLVIQRAWRRYSLKKKFHRMREKITLFFKTEEERNVAEEFWKKKSEAFYKELNK